MIVTIHQPQYLPWLGYFDKIDQADLFVILDNVQYKKNEFQNRNKIKTAQGWRWLTVPVKYHFPQKINEVKINNQIDWKRKHLNALISNYNKSTFFKNYSQFFEEVYSNNWNFLADLNTYIIKWLIEFFSIETKMLKASDLQLSEESTQRLIDICNLVKADTYLAGAGAHNYMDVGLFESAGIKIIFQKFQHPIYQQLFGNFEQYMSVIDLLFNHGPKSLEIIRKHCR